MVRLWQPAIDTCDLDKVRLTHLDGTPVDTDEYDRMQRFLRLWRKIGWSIDPRRHAISHGAAHTRPQIDGKGFGRRAIR